MTTTADAPLAQAGVGIMIVTIMAVFPAVPKMMIAALRAGTAMTITMVAVGMAIAGAMPKPLVVGGKPAAMMKTIMAAQAGDHRADQDRRAQSLRYFSYKRSF